MQIFITGATGFIGKHLVRHLVAEGHRVRAWVRSPKRAAAALGGDVELVDAGGGAAAMLAAIDGCDAVVNLAGESVIDGRWTERRRRELRGSRIDLTAAIVGAIASASVPPRVLVSASAVGFYGDGGEAELDESSRRGDGFLADLCAEWEEAARRAEELGVRVVVLRIGIVLGEGGGMLGSVLPAARLGLAGPMGSGRQFMPWIHVRDLVAMIDVALADPRYVGPLNGVGPAPATNRAMMQAIGKALGRPAFLPVPGFALRVGLGEAASALLGGQRALPRRAEALGFRFAFPTLEGALADLVGRG